MKLSALLVTIVTLVPAIALAHGESVAQNPPIANLNINSGERSDINQNANQTADDRIEPTTTNIAVSPIVVEPTNTNTQAGNTNSLSNTNTSSNNIAKLREPAKLLPLLLIPLAIILYLVYRRFSWRKE